MAQARGFRQLPQAVCFSRAEEPVHLSCSPIRAPHYALAPAWALEGIEEAFGGGWIKAGAEISRTVQIELRMLGWGVRGVAGRVEGTRFFKVRELQ